MSDQGAAVVLRVGGDDAAGLVYGLPDAPAGARLDAAQMHTMLAVERVSGVGLNGVSVGQMALVAVGRLGQGGCLQNIPAD